MRILFVADGRSPTALSWIEHFIQRGDEVHLATTFVFQPPYSFASVHQTPVAFSESVRQTTPDKKNLRKSLPVAQRTHLRNLLGPFTLGKAARKLKNVIQEVKPDLIHAMRIPYEGMMAAASKPSVPLIVSVWGNDFTLHARSNPLMGFAARRVTRTASALHTDTLRDLKLAHEFGFPSDKPHLIVPGNGGVRSEIFYQLPVVKDEGTLARLRVVNPRGLRAYVRNDVFFEAIPRVLSKRPEVRFYCPGMEGEPEAQRWVDQYRIGEYVSLMPKLSPRALADSFHSAQVMVSPSTHDGTPNSLLEAMACGVFPVCGDLESIREWIRHGENGLLVNPNDAEALADALLLALKDRAMRSRAAEINAKIVAERADYRVNMKRVEQFYDEVIKDVKS